MQTHLSGTIHIISITQREQWWWWWWWCSWWPSWSGWWWWGRLEVVASSRGNYWQFLVHLACPRHSPRARIATDLNRSQDTPQEILKLTSSVINEEILLATNPNLGFYHSEQQGHPGQSLGNSHIFKCAWNWFEGKCKNQKQKPILGNW